MDHDNGVERVHTRCTGGGGRGRHDVRVASCTNSPLTMRCTPGVSTVDPRFRLRGGDDAVSTKTGMDGGDCGPAWREWRMRCSNTSMRNRT